MSTEDDARAVQAAARRLLGEPAGWVTPGVTAAGDAIIREIAANRRTSRDHRLNERIAAGADVCGGPAAPSPISRRCVTPPGESGGVTWPLVGQQVWLSGRTGRARGRPTKGSGCRPR